MFITIQIQNPQDYQWLKPFLEALKKTTAKIHIQGALPAEEDFVQKRKAFLQFLDLHAIHVKKVEMPSREERNAR